jgi:two-component system cell cycle response regulator
MTLPVQTNQPLVLVVDDDLVVQMQLRLSMEKEGYKVIVAKNGEEALDIYTRHRPDIVLLDAIMPVMDGFTCCERLQALKRNGVTDDLSERTPVLMITGLDDPDSVDKAFDAGAADYITKPIHWAVLKQRVRRLLRMCLMMEKLHRQVEKEQLISKITQKIRQSLNLDVILNTTVEEIRKSLATDRVIVYKIEADQSASVLVESVAPEWEPALGKELKDFYFGNKYSRDYQPAAEDIHQAGFPQCQIDLLNQLQAKASVEIPIVQKGNLWGFLGAYQCSRTREWQELEQDLLEHIADQLVIAIQQAQLYEQIEAANQELQRLAITDSLTQIANRRHFDDVLGREWQRAQRDTTPLSLIFCDIDSFKTYNDTYGHQTGDECLKQVAQVLYNSIQRPADVVARYGGEEFVLILPNTDTEGAVHVAESIQMEMKTKAIVHHNSQVSKYVTLSLGIATLIPERDTLPELLIAKADKALYQAKQAGRDRFAIAT